MRFANPCVRPLQVRATCGPTLYPQQRRGQMMTLCGLGVVGLSDRLLSQPVRHEERDVPAQPRMQFPIATVNEEPTEQLVNEVRPEAAYAVAAAPAHMSPAFPDESPALSAEMARADEVQTEDREIRSVQLPPLNSAEKFAHPVSVEEVTPNIRPLGQLDESFII